MDVSVLEHAENFEFRGAVRVELIEFSFFLSWRGLHLSFAENVPSCRVHPMELLEYCPAGGTSVLHLSDPLLNALVAEKVVASVWLSRSFALGVANDAFRLSR